MAGRVRDARMSVKPSLRGHAPHGCHPTTAAHRSRRMQEQIKIPGMPPSFVPFYTTNLFNHHIRSIPQPHSHPHTLTNTHTYPQTNLYQHAVHHHRRLSSCCRLRRCLRSRGQTHCTNVPSLQRHHNYWCCCSKRHWIRSRRLCYLRRWCYSNLW